MRAIMTVPERKHNYFAGKKSPEVIWTQKLHDTWSFILSRLPDMDVCESDTGLKC